MQPELWGHSEYLAPVLLGKLETDRRVKNTGLSEKPQWCPGTSLCQKGRHRSLRDLGTSAGLTLYALRICRVLPDASFSWISS